MEPAKKLKAMTGDADGDRSISDTTKVDFRSLEMGDGVPTAKHAVLNIVSGRDVGRILVLEGTSISIGRSFECDVTLLGPGISRRHCELEYRGDGKWFLVDKWSTNGTLVNGVKATHVALTVDDLIRVGKETALKFGLADETEVAARAATYEASIRDALTGLSNRRHFLNEMYQLTDQSRRTSKPISVLLLDVDHFKKINDKHGHPVGDVVIKRVAECLRAEVRDTDSVCRYGGEEFAVALGGVGADDAMEVAEVLREKLAEMCFRRENESFQITVSIGISTARDSSESRVRGLIREADDNLYRAKRGGRNRTVGPTTDTDDA
ncbi:MAG: GGDEF domain-containing protein [Pseudomonadota bacterium]